MELFRPAGLFVTDPADDDWTRQHGYTQKHEFPFPDLYLAEPVAALLKEKPEMSAFLERCLRMFVNHDYGHMSSLDLADNYIQREFAKKTCWLRGIYPVNDDGKAIPGTYDIEIHLDILYDMGLFHLETVPARDLIRAQKAKELEA